VQIAQPERVGDWIEELVAVQEFGINQDGAGSLRGVDRGAGLRRDRADPEDRDSAVQPEVGRHRARVIPRYRTRLGDQLLEPGGQLERVGCVAHAIDRGVASAIVAADDESDVIAEGLMDIMADVVVCPDHVELEIEITDSIVPRSVVLRCTRNLFRLGLEGMTSGARRLLLGLPALARRAVGHEHDDG
jgi:hypothetical protein